MDMRMRLPRSSRLRARAGLAAAAWAFLATSCDAVIRQVFSFKEWSTDFVPAEIMMIFTEMDFQTAGVARAEGIAYGGSIHRDFGNPDAPISGGAGFGVFQTRPARFWLRDDLWYPQYGVAVSVFDDHWSDDDPVEALLRLYGVADRVLGEVSVTVPPANSMAEVSAGARFLAAVSSDPIRSWEFRISGNSQASFDDLYITYVAIAVPEPPTLGLGLVALAALGALEARRRRRVQEQRASSFA